MDVHVAEEAAATATVAPGSASASAGAAPVGGGMAGGRRLYFASPVARLIGVVVHGDVALVTSISDDHLTQLTMAATRNR